MSQGGPNSSSGTGGTALEKLTGNSGGVVGPDGAFNIDILGNNTTGIDIVGTPASNLLTVIGLASSTTQVGTVELATAIETGTLTDSTRAITPASLEPILITPFVVAPGGAYTTIQSAINAASVAGGGIVVVRPGTYVEDLTLVDDVHIMGMTLADAGGGVEITGIHTPPSTGGMAIRNCQLISATHIFSSVAAGSAHLILIDCAVVVTNGYTFNLPNWTGILESFDVNDGGGTNDGYVNNTGGATIGFFSGSYGVGTVNSMITSGLIFSSAAGYGCPINFQTGSNFEFDNSFFDGSLTFANNSTGYFANCHITSGAAAAITMSSSGSVDFSNSIFDSSNNPAIDGAGAGTLTLENVTFLDNAEIAATLTLGTAGVVKASQFETLPLDAGSNLSGSTWAADGSDANIDLFLTPKGTGGVVVPTNITAGETVQDVTFTINGTALTSTIALHTSGATDLGGFASERHSSTAAFGAHSILLRSRGVEGAPTVVQDNDSISRIVSAGYDGTDYAQSAEIRVEVDGTPGNDDMPGRIIFLTSLDGAQTPTEAMRIDSAQVITLANALPVSSGGTGASTLTGVLTGNGTGAFTASTVTDNTVVMGSTSNLLQDTTITVTDNGEMTNASQPAFLAYLPSTDNNATGDGTTYTLGGTTALTEVFDQNSDFNTNGTFTAPVSGNYKLGVQFYVTGATAVIGCDVKIVTSNRTYLCSADALAAAAGRNALVKEAVTLGDMDASDTATFTVATTDSGGKIDDIVGSGSPNNFCFGNLEC